MGAGSAPIRRFFPRLAVKYRACPHLRSGRLIGLTKRDDKKGGTTKRDRHRHDQQNVEANSNDVGASPFLSTKLSAVVLVNSGKNVLFERLVGSPDCRCRRQHESCFELLVSQIRWLLGGRRKGVDDEKVAVASLASPALSFVG